MPGKCILLGEHAVLRGHPAIVFPLRSKQLELNWSFSPRADTEVEVVQEDWQSPVLRCLEAVGKIISVPSGFWKFSLTSTIPMQGGLGSSAALAVAFTKVFHSLGLVPDAEMFPFALNIENVFHGTSSGLDIAAVLHDQAIRFVRGSQPQKFTPVWRPHLYLLDTGFRSSTKICVEQVERLQRPDLDREMGLLAKTAFHALRDTRESGLPNLAEAMIGGLEIFRAWNLVPVNIEQLIPRAISAGAIAVKPTGSGFGGFLLCLFEQEVQDPLFVSLF